MLSQRNYSARSGFMIKFGNMTHGCHGCPFSCPLSEWLLSLDLGCLLAGKINPVSMRMVSNGQFLLTLAYRGREGKRGEAAGHDHRGVHSR